MNTRRLGSSAFLAATLALFALQAPVRAQPAGKPPTVSIGVDVVNRGDSQYQTVIVTLQSLVSSKNERPVRVEIHDHASYGSMPQDMLLAVGADCVLPAGGQQTRVVMSFPGMPGTFFEVAVIENGSVVHTVGNGQPANWVGDGYTDFPLVLVVDYQLPDNREVLGAALGRFQRRDQMRSYSSPAPVTPSSSTAPEGGIWFQDSSGEYWIASLETVTNLPRERCFDRWTDYSGQDLVVIGQVDLQWLKDENPARLRALAEWTAAGGNLIVYGDDISESKLAEIDAVLGPASQRAEADADKPVGADWQIPVSKDYDVILHDVEYAEADPNSSSYYSYNVPTTNPNAKRGTPPDDPPFRWRTHGWGAVVALDSDEPIPSDQATCAWILNTLTRKRWSWAHRIGFRPSQGSDEFWNLLIPRTGHTPVGAFQILMTLFAITIGPLNYVLLRRRRKLPLLVVTVPLIALLTTTGIVVYAFASDGLGVRLRTRSFTQIDQRRGQAQCMARLSYYAGLTPSAGLTFPYDVAVMPLVEPIQYEQETVARSVTLDAAGQHFARGWLPARVPTQFVSWRSRASQARLEIAHLDKTAPPRVRNNVGVALRRLVVFDEAGNSYWLDSLAPGETKTMFPIELETAFVRCQALAVENEPHVPTGNAQSASGFFGFNRYYGAYSQGYGGHSTFDDSLLEGGISWLSDRRRWFDSQGAAAPQLRRSWLALSDGSPELEPGFEGAQREVCFDIIRGLW